MLFGLPPEAIEWITKAGAFAAVVGWGMWFMDRRDYKSQIAALLADLKAEREDNKEIAKNATIAMTKMETTLNLLAQIFSNSGKSAS